MSLPFVTVIRCAASSTLMANGSWVTDTSDARIQPVLPFGRTGSSTWTQPSVRCWRTRNTCGTFEVGTLGSTSHGLSSVRAGVAAPGVSYTLTLGTVAWATSEMYGAIVVVVAAVLAGDDGVTLVAPGDATPALPPPPPLHAARTSAHATAAARIAGRRKRGTAPKSTAGVTAGCDHGAGSRYVAWRMVARALVEASAELARREPRLRASVEQLGPAELRRARPRREHFAELARAISYQQLAGAAARSIHGRFEQLFDGRPTPELVLAAPVESLRAVGLSAAKAASIRDLAEKVVSG